MARRLPPYASGPYTPVQGARQADGFLAGLTRLRGWRGLTARALALVAVLLLIAVLVAGAVRAL